MPSPTAWFRIWSAAASVVLVAGACAPRVPTPPIPPRDDTVLVQVEPGVAYEDIIELRLARLTKVRCPGGSDRARTARIGAEGGPPVTVNGHRLEVPAGAVSAPTQFVLTEVRHPRHLVVRAYAVGVDSFPVPVALTISYARCDSAQVDGRTLRIVRERSSAPGEDLGGEQAPDQRVIRAHTNRLSSFVVSF